MIPKNRNRVKCNLPKEELQALHELIQLQKDQQIIIKPWDKGAEIIILNFQDYIKSCSKHLKSKQTNADKGEESTFYKKVDPFIIEHSKNQITQLLQEGLDNRIISKLEYEAMSPEEKGPGRFYCTFKVHKIHEVGSIPPERPIVSCNNSITENIGQYVEFHIKDLSTQHESYLQDPPHFLRHIDVINKKNKLPENAILVTRDVSSLFTNIPHDEGISCVTEVLNEAENKSIPTGFLTRMLGLVLKHNIFDFNNDFFQQIIGAAMGSRPAPPYANIFMARIIDKKITELSNLLSENNKSKLLLFKRFLDDLFMIFLGTSKQLHIFFSEINKIHPNIKFTMSHTLIKMSNCLENVNVKRNIQYRFWTHSVKKNGQIITDLYRKPNDCNQYLLTSSCHPIECFENIPFSLAMRINRICAEPHSRDKRFAELKDLLLNRGYLSGMSDYAINKAGQILHEEALKKVIRSESDKRPVFVVTFDPRLPSIPAIQQKHWRAMVNMDPYMAEGFPSPPLIAYKRQRT